MLDTLENVKERLVITTDEYDAFLSSQIQVISDAIEGYCRRKFAQADYIQTFYKSDMVPNKALSLFHFPVSEVASIVEDGSTVDSSEYRFNTAAGIVIGKDGKRFGFSDELIVSYTAGYEEIPPLILNVLDSLVQQAYNKKTIGAGMDFGRDVSSVTIPGALSIKFDYSRKSESSSSSFNSILGEYTDQLDYFRSERSITGDGKLIDVQVDV